MSRISLALCLLALSFSSQALEEKYAYSEIVDYLQNGKKCDGNPNQDFWELKSVKTPFYAFQSQGKKYHLRYSKFGCSIGKKGALVIGPGRTEASVEYYETAIDFIKRGYSPVYVIDHRGQGFSPRLLENTYKGHVVNFLDYSSDLNSATIAIQKELKTMGFSATDNLYYTSNSMGGAIWLGYLGTVKGKVPYKKAAILGAQIRVNYLSYIDKEPTVLNNAIYSEAGVIAQATLACKVQGKCNEFARNDSFGTYTPGSRQFVYEDNVRDQEKFMTHSKNRYDLKTYIWDTHDWSALINEAYQGENWISPALGGTTFSWTYTATKFLLKMRSKKFIKGFPNVPLLILTGSNDHRAYKPLRNGGSDLSRHLKYCKKINRHNKHTKKLCTFKELKGSFHEIYKESDIYRNEGIESVDKFLSN